MHCDMYMSERHSAIHFTTIKIMKKRLKSLRIPQGIQKPELKDGHTIKCPNEKYNRRNNYLKKNTAQKAKDEERIYIS